MPRSRPQFRSRESGKDLGAPASHTSVPRLVVVALVVVAGIAWLAIYLTQADGTSGGAFGWMTGLKGWNFVIGFGLIFAGLGFAAHPSTPLGRGRGVVVGMLGSFLIGLLWIVLYYIVGSSVSVPLLSDLGQYNLLVGIGFMAVGFVYATHWE